VGIFKNSAVLKIARYPEGAPGPKGPVMTASFSLDGQEFLAHLENLSTSTSARMRSR